MALRSKLKRIALSGLHSGDPFEPAPGYWEAKHAQLEKRLKSTEQDDAARRSAVEGIRQGLEDARKVRSMPAREFFAAFERTRSIKCALPTKPIE